MAGASIVTQLAALNSLGQSLLVQLYNVKTFLTDGRIRPDFASPNNAKIAKALTAKFPEIPPVDKVPGLDLLLKGNSSELMTTIEPHYYAFVDMVDFRDLSLKTMMQVVESVPVLRMEVNPDLFELFMDLFSVWCQVVLLCTQIEERKLLLAFHHVLFGSIHSGSTEPNSGKVIQFMKDFGEGTHTLKRIWDELRGIGKLVVASLGNYFPTWFMKVRNVDGLRNDGTLGIHHDPAKLSLPAGTNPIYEDLLRAHKVNNWFYFGFLCCPESLADNAGAQDCLKFVIADTFVAPLHKDETYPLMSKEWDEVSSFKTKTVSFSKTKKAFKEGLDDQKAKCFQTHKERRTLARQELFMLKQLLSDTPALIAPKLPVLLSALSIAKDELLWYYRNRINAAKANKANADDPFIPEMIHTMLQLKLQLQSLKGYIINYYIEYLKGADSIRLEEIISDASFKGAVHADVTTVLGWMIGWLKSAEPGRVFSDVRQKWAEIQTLFIDNSRTAPIDKVKPVVERVQQIMFHTRVVDSFDEMISEHSSLRSLWYFRSQVQSSFERSIVEGQPQPASQHSFLNQSNQFSLHCMTFIPLVSQAVENSTMFDPFERDRIGQDSIIATMDFLNKILDCVIQDLDAISTLHLAFDLQLEASQSVGLFANKLAELTAANQGTEAAAAAKRVTEKLPEVVLPGTESTFVNKPQWLHLRAQHKHLWQLLSAIDEFGSVLVYNSLITPREFLISKIKKLFKSILERHRYIPQPASPFKDDSTIYPPSHLARVIRVYANFFKQLDQYLSFDSDLLVNQVLLKQVYSSSLGATGGKLDWMTDKGFEYSDNVIKVVAKWYSDFFARRISTPQLNIVYSPIKRGFVSKIPGTGGFKAEKYLDFVELTKLASVIGPYGVKIIDREILRFVVSNMNSLLTTLRNVRNDLTELTQTYFQETTTTQVLKSLKPTDLDSFIGSSVVIGNALTFRKLLYGALGEVCGTNIPLIQNAVSNAFHQYLRNTFMAVDFVGMDSMAQDAGVDVSIADQPLKVALLPLSTSDRAMWDLLPAAYAASFLISSHWKEAIYNPSLGAFENNIHVLLTTISELLINFKALSGEGHNDESTIRDQLVKFLDISGTLLLRGLASPKLDQKLVPKDWASLFVFLDLFVQHCPLLTRNELESILPYALLRSMWRTIYQKTAKGKSEETDI